MIEYPEYKYLWPPRPEKKITPSALQFLHEQGYAAQVKKNGTYTVIFARGSEVIFKTRHGPDDYHKAWKPLPQHYEFFASEGDKWNVYAAELLHSKTPHIKNQLYIFDQLVCDGMQLVGVTFDDRQKILNGQWKVIKEEKHQNRVGEFVSIARTFNDNFQQLWNELGLPSEDEGLVLKRRSSKLERCLRQRSNEGWQVKCRRPASNYSF